MVNSLCPGGFFHAFFPPYFTAIKASEDTPKMGLRMRRGENPEMHSLNAFDMLPGAVRF